MALPHRTSVPIPRHSVERHLSSRIITLRGFVLQVKLRSEMIIAALRDGVRHADLDFRMVPGAILATLCDHAASTKSDGNGWCFMRVTQPNGPPKDQGWRSTEHLAWTERDGPGRPPRGVSSPYLAGISVVLAVALGVVIGGDSLCPEHRGWVRSLGVIGIALSVSALAVLVRHRAIGPVLALGAATTGVAIGVIDAFHSPVRGSFVVAGFAVAGMLSALPMKGLMQSRAWAASVHRELQPLAEPTMAELTMTSPVDASSDAVANQDSSVPVRG